MRKYLKEMNEASQVPKSKQKKAIVKEQVKV